MNTPIIYDANGRALSSKNQYGLLTDDLSVPHVLTFSSILTSGWRAYWHEMHDEAMRHSREDALAMWSDASIQSLIDERILSVISKPWRIEVPDEKDPLQKEVQSRLTTMLEGVPFLQKMLRSWALAIWYGRYAVNIKWKWVDVEGHRCLTVGEWSPINGDKVGYQTDNTPYIMVNPSYTEHYGKRAELIVTTYGGYGLVLRDPWWRSQFVIHKHNLDDADFFEPEAAGAIGGVGLRSYIYWWWYLRQEWLAKLSNFLDQAALGVKIWYYPMSNNTAKDAVKAAAKDLSADRTNILVPVSDEWMSKGLPPLERVDVPMSGAEFLKKMMEYTDEVMERRIVGQTMSGGSDNESGLGGTGRADFARDTKFQITKFDAINLAETITGSEDNPGLVSMMQAYSFPNTVGKFKAKFTFSLESPESKEKLDAVSVLIGAGLPIKSEEAYAAAGFTPPGEGDETIGGQQPGQQPGMPGQPPMPGMPGGDAPEDGDNIPEDEQGNPPPGMEGLDDQGSPAQPNLPVVPDEEPEEEYERHNEPDLDEDEIRELVEQGILDKSALEQYQRSDYAVYYDDVATKEPKPEQPKSEPTSSPQRDTSTKQTTVTTPQQPKTPQPIKPIVPQAQQPQQPQIPQQPSPAPSAPTPQQSGSEAAATTTQPPKFEPLKINSLEDLEANKDSVQWVQAVTQSGKPVWINNATKERIYSTNKPAKDPYKEAAKWVEKRTAEPQLTQGVDQWGFFKNIGKELTGDSSVKPEVLAEAVGGSKGAEYRVSTNGFNKIKIDLYNDHHEIKQQERVLETKDDGSLLMKNAKKIRRKNARGQGGGAIELANQIKGMIKLGGDKINTIGGRGGGLMGYLVWPILGFNAEIDNDTRDKLLRSKTLPSSVKQSATVRDLVSTPEGRMWWKKYGDDTSFSIDISENSPDIKHLNEYLERKGLGEHKIHIPEGYDQKKQEANTHRAHAIQERKQRVYGNILDKYRKEFDREKISVGVDLPDDLGDKLLRQELGNLRHRKYINNTYGDRRIDELDNAQHAISGMMDHGRKTIANAVENGFDISKLFDQASKIKYQNDTTIGAKALSYKEAIEQSYDILAYQKDPSAYMKNIAPVLFSKKQDELQELYPGLPMQKVLTTSFNIINREIAEGKFEDNPNDAKQKFNEMVKFVANHMSRGQRFTDEPSDEPSVDAMQTDRKKTQLRNSGQTQLKEFSNRYYDDEQYKSTVENYSSEINNIKSDRSIPSDKKLSEIGKVANKFLQDTESDNWRTMEKAKSNIKNIAAKFMETLKVSAPGYAKIVEEKLAHSQEKSDADFAQDFWHEIKNAKRLNSVDPDIYQSTEENIESYFVSRKEWNKDKREQYFDLMRSVRPMGLDAPLNFTDDSDPKAMEWVNNMLEYYPSDWVEAVRNEFAIQAKWTGNSSHSNVIPRIRYKNDEDMIQGKGYVVLNLGNETHARHELAHLIEMAVPEVKRAEKQIFDKRTAGQDDFLRHGTHIIKGGFHPNHYYLGADNNGKGYEIISKGLDLLFDDTGWSIRSEGLNEDQALKEDLLGLMLGVRSSAGETWLKRRKESEVAAMAGGYDTFKVPEGERKPLPEDFVRELEQVNQIDTTGYEQAKDRYSTMAAQAIENPNLGEEQRRSYKEAYQRVSENLTPAAWKYIDGGRLSDIKYHNTSEEAMIAAYEFIIDSEQFERMSPENQQQYKQSLKNIKEGKNSAAAAYASIGGKAMLSLDGDSKEYQDYEFHAHELGHAVDGVYHKFSRSDLWKRIWEAEINQKGKDGTYPLSEYASVDFHLPEKEEGEEASPDELERATATATRESFAEMMRLVLSGDIPPEQIEQTLPMATAFLKAHGLWPHGEGGGYNGSQDTLDSPQFDPSLAGVDQLGDMSPERIEDARKQWEEKGTDSPYFKAWFGDSKVRDENGQPVLVHHGTPNGIFNEFDKSKIGKKAERLLLYGPGFYFTEDSGVAKEYSETGQKLELTKSPKKVYQELRKRLRESKRQADESGNTSLSDNIYRTLSLSEGALINQALLGGNGVSYFRNRGVDVSDLATNDNSKIYDVYLSIQNPFNIDSGSISTPDGEKIAAEIMKEYESSIWLANPPEEVKRIANFIAKGGEDFVPASFVYEKLVDLFDKKTANEILQKAGYDGITHIGGKIMGDKEHRVWIAFEPNQIKSATGNRGTFDSDNARIDRMFAGQNAKTADQTAFQRAQKLLGDAKKYSELTDEERQRIREETGYFVGQDGKMRFELDDSKAHINEDTFQKMWTGEPKRLGDVLEHQELFKAYPDLANITVKKDLQGFGGQYVPKNGKFPEEINLGRSLDKKDMLGVLLHEVQHAIQHREGFASGGNKDSLEHDEKLLKIRLHGLESSRETKEAMESMYNAFDDLIDKDEYTPENTKKIRDEYASKYPEIEEIGRILNKLQQIGKLHGGEYYRLLAGENEANATKADRNLTAEERLQRQPYANAPKQVGDWIVRDGNGTSFSVEPVDEDNPSDGVKNLVANILRFNWKPEDHGLTQEQVQKIASHGLESKPTPKKEEKKFDGGNVVTYRVEAGKGLFDRSSYDLNKLDDDEATELAEWLNFGLQQPVDVPNGSVFYFTEDGEKRNKKFIDLLKKAATSPVVRHEEYRDDTPIWESSDGQLAFGQPANPYVEEETALPRRERVVRSPEFKRWFGDWENDPQDASKVVDENGQPLVVYHGTKSADWNVVDPDKGDLGFHVGTQSQAKDFVSGGDGKIIPMFAKIKNPIRLRDIGVWTFDKIVPQLEIAGIEIPESVKNERKKFEYAFGKEYQLWSNKMLRSIITNAGHDGVVYLNRTEGIDHKGVKSDAEILGEDPNSDKLLIKHGATDSYIAFEPNQIKSATANDDFDPNDARIDHMEAASKKARKLPQIPLGDSIKRSGLSPKYYSDSAGVYNSVSFLQEPPEGIDGGYALGISDDQNADYGASYFAMAEAMDLIPWTEAYHDVFGNVNHDEKDPVETTNEFMQALDKSGKPIVMFVPNDALGESSEWTKAELEYLRKHPELRERTHFVFGAYDTIKRSDLQTAGRDKGLIVDLLRQQRLDQPKLFQSREPGEEIRWEELEGARWGENGEDYGMLPQEGFMIPQREYIDSLDLDTVDAVAEYTTALGYETYNEALRKYGDNYEGEVDERVSDHINIIRETLNNVPELAQPITTYRGLSLDQKDYNKLVKFLSQVKEDGLGLQKAGFLSTSVSPVVAGKYFAEAGAGGKRIPLVYEIQASKGLYLGRNNESGDSLSDDPNEMEFLLNHDTVFKVDRMEMTKYHIPLTGNDTKNSSALTGQSNSEEVMVVTLTQIPNAHENITKKDVAKTNFGGYNKGVRLPKEQMEG